MSSIPARPQGAREPPRLISVPLPTFRYGLKASTSPAWKKIELQIVPQGGQGGPVASAPRPVDDWLMFEFQDLEENVRYDGILLHDGRETPLFHGVELYRLAVEDGSYRVLPPPRRG